MVELVDAPDSKSGGSNTLRVRVSLRPPKNMKIKNYISKNYSNYLQSKSSIIYPRNKKDIVKAINFAKKNKLKILSLGSSLSWFDTIFNTNNVVINLNKYKKTFKFKLNIYNYT